MLTRRSPLVLALALAGLSSCGGDSGEAGSGAGPGGRGSAAGRGVLVIAVDGLRADHVSSGGYDRETTPVLDRLAAQGTCFDQTFTTAPWAMPAHVSLLTGCDPYIALRFLPETLQPTMVTLWHVPQSTPRLAKEFLRGGYATAAFSDHPWLAPVHGFGAGFQSFFEVPLGGGVTVADLGVEGIGNRFEQWLRNRPRDKKWFAYVHLHDLERGWRDPDPRWATFFEPRAELDRVPPVALAFHAYFAVPRRRWPGGMLTVGEYEAQYDGAIRRLDSELGRLFTRLDRMGRWETTTIVVVGTHGMGLGEAGVLLDHGTLSDIDLHVPLIVRLRAGTGVKRGVRSATLASLMDVAPTLLQLEGLGQPRDLQGRPLTHGVSLAPVLRGADVAPREYLLARCGFQAGYVVLDNRWCYEWTLPWAVRDAELALSWYGRTHVQDEVPREVLHDRWEGGDLGHLGIEPRDPVVIARLQAAAEDLLTIFDEARRAYQKATWPTPPDKQGMSGGRLPSGGSPASPP